MRKLIGVYFVLAAIFAVASCGGGSGDGNGSLTVSSVKDLPGATSPMATVSASASKSIFKGAATGQILGTTDGSSNQWGAGKSRGSCEVFNFVKDSIKSAGQADQTLCYVKQIDAANKLSFDNNGNPINIYDNSWHIFNMNLIGDEGAPSRIAMKIRKNAAGGIDYFKMYMCGGTGADMVQKDYVYQSIDGVNFVMQEIGNYGDSWGTGWHYVDVTGTLNSSSSFTRREITTQGVNSSNLGGENNQYGVLTQTPGQFVYSGFQYGSFVQGEFSGSYENLGYAVGELLGDTGRMMEMAMGDGAVMFSGGGTNNGFEWTNPQQTESWSGDSLTVVDSNDFTALLSQGTLPVRTDIVLDNFVDTPFGDVSWDCSDTIEGEQVEIVDLVEIDVGSVDEVGTIKNVCSEYSFEGNEWINCYGEIESENEGGGAEQVSFEGPYNIDVCGNVTDPVVLSDDSGVITGTSDSGSEFTINYDPANYVVSSITAISGGNPIDCSGTILNPDTRTITSTCQLDFGGGASDCILTMTPQ